MRIVLKKKNIKEILEEAGIHWVEIIHSGDEEIVETEDNIVSTSLKDPLGYKIITFEESNYYKRLKASRENIPESYINKEERKREKNK